MTVWTLLVIITLIHPLICIHAKEYEETTVQPNPDQFLTTPQLITRHGYQAESHTIQTKDGYLLTLHRIPASKNGTKGDQPIFLQHGLLSSSVDWVNRGDDGLGFLLADQGYDVWLGNIRGNVYSKAHVSLPPYSPQFWNFSWHEMGMHDVPAAINHIANVTGRGGDILYVGHSMGTTMFFVFASLRLLVARNVQAMIALAPVAYMTHVRSPIRYLSPWINDLEFLAKHLGINAFQPSPKIMAMLSYECRLTLPTSICDNVIFTLFGFDKDQVNSTLVPIILSHDPAGASTKTMLHYLQEIASKSGDFKQFDYGAKGNMAEYGQLTPPLYDFKRITVPTYLMYADNDMLASPMDVKRLASKLAKNAGMYHVPNPGFDHVDFLWAKDAKQLVYEPLITFLRNFKR